MQTFHAAGVKAALAIVWLAAQPGLAQDFKAGDLIVQQPWTRATPGGAQVAGGYVTIVNHGSAPDRLTGGSLEAASKFGLHEMTAENGVMKMRPTGPLTIAPGGTLTLSPTGKHIMFTGLRRGLKKGETVAGTLTFEHAGTVAVQFAVESLGAPGPSGSAPSMPGMTMD